MNRNGKNNYVFKYLNKNILSNLAALFGEKEWSEKLENKNLWDKKKINEGYLIILDNIQNKNYLCQCIINFGGNLKKIGVDARDVETEEYYKIVSEYNNILHKQLDKNLEKGIEIPEYFKLDNLNKRIDEYLSKDYKFSAKPEILADIKVILSSRSGENDLYIDSDGNVKGTILKKRGKVNEYKLVSCIGINKAEKLTSKWKLLKEEDKKKAIKNLSDFMSKFNIKVHDLRTIGIELAVEYKCLSTDTLGKQLNVRKDAARHSGIVQNYMKVKKNSNSDIIKSLKELNDEDLLEILETIMDEKKW